MTMIRAAALPILSKAPKDKEGWVVGARQQVSETLARRRQQKREGSCSCCEEARRADSTTLGGAQQPAQ